MNAAHPFHSVPSGGKHVRKSDATGRKNLKIGEIEKKYTLLFEELRKSEQEKAVILDAMTELVLFLDT